MTGPPVETNVHGDPVVFDPGVYTIPQGVYRAAPGLSSTGLRKFRRSPLAFRWDQQHPGAQDTDAFRFGRIVHALVLKDPTVHIKVVDFPDKRTKAAQQAIADTSEPNVMTVLGKELDVPRAMAEAAWTHPLAGPLLTRPGKVELSLFWDDPATGVRCKARPDFIPDPSDGSPLIVVDYKTAKDISPSGFNKAVDTYGYHQQAAWYLRGARALGLADHHARWVFVVQENTPPYDLAVYELSTRTQHGPGWLQLGAEANDDALAEYVECTRTGAWPGLSDLWTGAHTLTPAPWMVRQIEQGES